MAPQVVKARREAGARVAGGPGAAAGADQAAAIAAAAAYLMDQQQGRASRRGGVQRAMADAVRSCMGRILEGILSTKWHSCWKRIYVFNPLRLQ